MNVRFYMERAQRANRLLLADLGVGADEGEAPGVRAGPGRHLLPLSARAVPGPDSDRQRRRAGGDARRDLRAFYELANPAKGEIAATFIIVNALTDPATGGAAPLPARR